MTLGADVSDLSTAAVGAARQGLSIVVPLLNEAAGLARLVPDLVERDVYLCGPPGLTDAVRSALRAAGLPAEQLHEERFSF